MKVKLVGFTPKPLEAIATAAAITRGTTDSAKAVVAIHATADER